MRHIFVVTLDVSMGRMGGEKMANRSDVPKVGRNVVEETENAMGGSGGLR